MEIVLKRAGPLKKLVGRKNHLSIKLLLSGEEPNTFSPQRKVFNATINSYFNEDIPPRSTLTSVGEVIVFLNKHTNPITARSFIQGADWSGRPAQQI